MLESRQALSQSQWVFAAEDGANPLSISTLEDQHSRLRKALRLPRDFVIHSLRHTFGTRLGESGADAFTIMKVMGHSCVTVSQRYVHPTPEALERLHAMNARNSNLALPEGSKMPGVPTIPTTLDEPSQRTVS
jgi:site-specific recombinase XerD